MSNIFKEKRRGEILRYARPNIGHVELEDGTIATVPPNVPRLEYRDGYLHGIKMGDGDTLSIPLSLNEEWATVGGTIVATYNAPLASTFITCGDVVLTGYGALKTIILHLTTEQLAAFVEAQTTPPTLPANENAHFLHFKYYSEDPQIEATTEFEAMEELNLFTHGAWQ